MALTPEDLVITDMIDAGNVTFEVNLPAAQATYKEEHGDDIRYWQALPTFTEAAIPVDGVEATPDNLDAKPVDVPLSWADMEATSGISPCDCCATSINEYVAPGGAGFEVIYEAKINGRKCQKVVNFGPETYRDQPWTDEIPE